jgi:hypothetical protein
MADKDCSFSALVVHRIWTDTSSNEEGKIMNKNITATKSGPAIASPAAKPATSTVLVTNSVCTSSEPLVREVVTIKLSNPAK